MNCLSRIKERRRSTLGCKSLNYLDKRAILVGLLNSSKLSNKIDYVEYIHYYIIKLCIR